MGGIYVYQCQVVPPIQQQYKQFTMHLTTKCEIVRLLLEILL